MTPKEKAEELVNKFSDLEDGEMYIGKAKQCALIAVDEIITFGNQLGIREPMMFWEQVKQELDNL